MNKEKHIIDLLSQVGKLLLQHGAETHIVESGIKDVAYKLGYKDISILVLPNTIILNLASKNDIYHTKLQRAIRQDVNFKALDKMDTIINNITNTTDVKKLLSELKDEQNISSMYPFYLRNIMAGVGCGAFSLMFGGDFFIFLTTFIAAFSGYWLNSFLLKQFFNPFVTIVIVAFTTTLISGIMALDNTFVNLAIASSILFLVPSVAFINSINDLIKGHYTNGVSRGIRGIIISFAIAIGISIALHILGVENFV